MMPASSNSFTVRYTVEIEILSSTATQRRYSSSTSGWSSASASTRAITRRCSVMRMPVAAQRASMPVALSAGVDFKAVMDSNLGYADCSATARGSRQVAPHQDGVQLFTARLFIIAFAASCHGKSGPIVKPPRRLIVFLDFEEHGAHAAAREMPQMRQQKVARQAAAAMFCVDGDRQDFGFIRRHPRHGEADDFPPLPQAVHQRIALGQHLLEFGVAPAAMKRGAMQLRQFWRVAQARGLDRERATAPQIGQPGDHGADGCAGCRSMSFCGFASGARR